MHMMIQNVVHFYRTKSTKSDMQCYFCDLYAHIFYFLKQFRCKM